MKKKITMLLMAGIIPAFMLSAQVPVKVVGDMNIASSAQLKSNGTMYVDMANSKNGRILNNGTLNLPKGIVFASDENSDGMLLNNNTVNLGSTQSDIKVIKRMEYAENYYYVSFPFDVKVGDIVGETDNTVLDTDYYLAEYDGQERADFGHEGETWVWIYNDVAGNNKILKSGTAYLIYTEKPISLVFPAYAGTEKMYATPDLPVSVTYYTGNRTALSNGWNLIGCRQTTSFDLNTNTLDGYVGYAYFYDKENDAWLPYDLDPLFGDKVGMAPYAGFFAQVEFTVPGSSEDVVFRSGGRNLSDVDIKFRSTETSAIDLLQLKLQANSSEASDFLRVIMADQYSDDFKIGEDAIKMISSSEKNKLPTFYSLIDNDPIAFSKMKASERKDIPLGIITKEEGSYNIGIDKLWGYDGKEIYLIDKELNNLKHNLLQGDYTFNAGMLKTDDRFELRIGNKETNIDDLGTSDIYVFAENSMLYVKNAPLGDMISVYNTTGQLVGEKEVTSKEITISLPEKGVYLVKITGSISYSTKVINSK